MTASSRSFSIGTWLRDRARFDRNELAGAFGDIGTDLPLIVGMILASGMDPAGVLIIFGLLQMVTALLYGIPMPVQPLKAVAAIVIAGKLSGPIIAGGGLAIGATMLALTLTGAIVWLGRVIPKEVIRGLQFGLGLQLSWLALTRYVQAEGLPGYILAAVAFVITIVFLGNRKYPAALIVIGLGIVYAFVFSIDLVHFSSTLGVSVPNFETPSFDDILQGFLLLALPQIPLSIGNSLLATHRVAHDLFPARAPGLRKIGLTYSFMNLIGPLFGGVPTCHGSGGIAGHYTFGARTGGSVIIYGSIYLAVGLFFSAGFADTIKVFPLPLLGVILMFEGIALLRLIRDTTSSTRSLFIALVVGVIAAALPYGFLVGMIVGVGLSHLPERVWSRPQ